MKEINKVQGGENIRYAANVDPAGISANRGGGDNPTFRYEIAEQGKGTQLASQVDFNTYGKDIENFKNFKGNDKHDAMRMTSTAANDVKRAYMQLQHEYPEIALLFEPMPDPKTCGKKREGMFNYQQLLENWKNNALQQINDAREQSFREMAEDVKQNDNKNAAFNAGVTAAAADAVMETVAENAGYIQGEIQNEGEKTRGTVKAEGQKTRGAVHSEGRRTRAAVHAEGAATRATVHAEGAATRATVKQVGNAIIDQNAENTKILSGQSAENTKILLNNDEAQHNKTRQEVQEQADRVISTLDSVGVKRAASWVRDKAIAAGKSVGEFIADNPELLIPDLGIPLYASKKLFD